ncbi:hypothetical protein B6D29_00910 [Microgenomates bacterium UTCPR1]|nr:MAG: hypothetical protein B6D29_00910 [Microgenomates bacterium UTCPR1]
MDVLEVDNLKKAFGDFVAVDEVSFTIKDGEVLGVLGPNGAGKTTTIQMLLGALTPTSGKIRYFGKDLSNNREEILEQINFSSTYTQMPENLRLREILTYTAYLYPVFNINGKISELIRTFQLEDLIDKEIHTMSAGQKTRANLAKAFINKPKVLLLDEPTASLDPELAGHVRDIILSEKERSNISVLFTSHNMAEIEEICDRVIFMNQGKIVANDTPDNLAKTIEICHLDLLIIDGLKRTIEMCEKEKRKYRLSGRSIVIDVKEKELAEFLRNLMKRGIFYDRISIEKPTLEDYFLSETEK